MQTLREKKPKSRAQKQERGRCRTGDKRGG